MDSEAVEKETVCATAPTREDRRDVPEHEPIEKEFLSAVAEDPEKASAMIAANASLLVARYSWGGTALHYAVIEDWVAGVKCLLEHGADPDLPDDGGETPLMSAVKLGNLECLELLLAHGADPHAKDPILDDSVLSMAVWTGNPQAIDLLMAAGARLEEIDGLRLELLREAPVEQREPVLAVLRAHGLRDGVR